MGSSFCQKIQELFVSSVVLSTDGEGCNSFGIKNNTKLDSKSGNIGVRYWKCDESCVYDAHYISNTGHI